MSKRTRCNLEQLEAREVPSAMDLIAVGGQPTGVARLYNADGTLRFQVRPFTTPLPVSVQVAVGDVTGDGTPDLITAVGLRSGARVKVFDGTDGSKVAGLAAFPAAFRDRVSVTSADFNGDGRTDIAIAAGLRPRVKIIDGQTLSVLESFSVPPWSQGGVRLTTGDVNGDGAPELIVAHAVGAPRVIIYDGSQVLQSEGSPTRLVPDFFPFARTLRTGVQVAAADVQNDGFADLIFGGGGDGRQVRVWDGKEFAASDGAERVTLLASTLSGKVAGGGVRVGSTDVNGDDQADVLAANGIRQAGSVRAYVSSDFSAEPTVVVSLPGFSTGSVAANHEAAVSISSPRILLSPGKLAALRQQAEANSPQWQAFKSRLDQGLTRILNLGSYQGSSLSSIADYALGYQVLKESDPATAANYADKAIAMMKSALRDYQKGGWEARQFLARGDGTTTTFTLPHSDVLPSSLRVYLGNIGTQAVVRGNTPSDVVGYYALYLKVSNTSDGPASHIQGVDWQRNGNLRNNELDWSLPGSEPAAGSTYYVTYTSGLGAAGTGYTQNGNTITLNSAPATNKAVLVEYIYGTHSANGSTLAYQQTSGGDGGFNSIMVDSSYTSRYLGKYVSIGYDWLHDYVGFTPALKAEAADMLVRWSDFVRDHGYAANSPASNYGTGGYVSRMFSALALSGRDDNGDGLVGEMDLYRQTFVLPALQNTYASLKGGFWSEGWSYGDLAAQNLLLAGLAFEQAGLGSASAERTWANEVTRHLIAAQPTPSTVYDGGDWFTHPTPLPGNDLFAILAVASTDATARAYDNYIIQTRPASNSNSFVDLLYRDPSATGSFWSDAPLHHRVEGTGLVTARADWNYDSTWVSFQLGNLLWADHQSYTPGQLQIQRGADGLLINAPVKGNYQPGAPKSQFGNIVAIDDNGEGAQNYRYSMGYWYGTPGVVTTAYEATNGYVYVAGDYHAAYSKNTNPGAGGSASELTRQVVYLRPDFIVVHDRATTIKDTYLKQVQWHFLTAPTVNGNSWVESVGSSKLFGQTFSTQTLTTTLQPVTVGNATVSQVATRNTNPTATVRYVTALQTAPSSTASMVASQMVVSTDGRMEGVQMGNQLVLFGTNGPVDPATPIAYSAAGGSGTVEHLLTDLQAGRSYQLRVNGALVGSFQASSQGTLSFSTAGGATIQLS